jgi:hypothetical protein
MEYREAVQEARQLIKRSEEDQWRLAQLTWEQVQAGKSAAQWARDIGIHPNHATALRRTWEQFGHLDEVTRPRFTDAYAEARSPGWGEQGEAVSRARSTVRNMPPEQKAEVVREALAEPAVAERVVADDQTALNIAKARGRHTHQRETEQTEAQGMRAPQLADAGDLAELGNNMAHIATRLEMLAEQVQRTRTDQREQFAREWADIKRLVGWVDSVLSGQSMDEGLTKLLNGGEDR